MKTDIEYAALPAGLTLHWHKVEKGLPPFYIRSETERPAWRPLEDDGDSRRLEAACMKWIADHGASLADRGIANFEALEQAMLSALSGRRIGYDTGDLQAISASVFALAVAIGKVIDGGGV